MKTTTTRTNPQWAKYYKVSPRTVNRMKRDGVNLEDATAVARWLAGRRIACPQALARVIEILDTLPQPEPIS